MSDAPAITHADVLDTARAIVKRQPRRGAIGTSVKLINAMAHAICQLDDAAQLATEFVRLRNAWLAASIAGDSAVVSDVDERVPAAEAALTDRLLALGYVHIIPEMEITDER